MASGMRYSRKSRYLTGSTREKAFASSQPGGWVPASHQHACICPLQFPDWRLAQERSMQYSGSEYTIELGWSVTIVWCKQSRRMQNCPRRPLPTTHFHLMETLRVRLLLVWSDIGRRMQHEIRCWRARRSGQGMPAQIWPIYREKGHGKISLGILALASSTLLGEPKS
jgi:hypothetical protein